MGHPDEYIWIVRWGDFQNYQRKRGKPWAPPWLMNHTRQLDNADYLRLTAAERGLLHDLRLDFARSRLELPAETLYLSRRFGYKVLRKQLERLNDAGFIVLCSRTVLEQFRNAFWNCSTLEVEVEKEVDVETTPEPEPELPLRSDESADIDFEANGAGAGTDLHTQREKPSNLQAQLRKQIDARREAGDLDTPIEYEETHYTIPPSIPEPLPERLIPNLGDIT